MKSKLESIFRNDAVTIPAIILLLVILAYGLFIPWIGFYWDDWAFAWLLRSFGPGEFIPAFSTNRPLLGPIFALTTSIFGHNPLPWQILGLGIRFLLSLELYFLLKLVFPSDKQKILWVVLLFTVYTAFGQQWVALTHINQEMIPLAFLLFSFLVSLRILREPNTKTLMPLALLTQFLGLFATEYFFGLEIIRFLFILKIKSEQFTGSTTLKSALARRTGELFQEAARSWAPYLVVWILNAAWLFWFHQSSAYHSYDVQLLSSSLLSLSALVNEFLSTLSLSTFTAWLRGFELFTPLGGSSVRVAALILLFAVALILYLFAAAFLRNLKPSHKTVSNFGAWAAAVGFIGIFAGRLPSWTAGFELRLDFDHDRFFIAIMLGASLFIVGLFELLLKASRVKIVALSLLIGLCVSQQFLRADSFRRDWVDQRAFFWQLVWRVPRLRENTLILADTLPFDYVYDLHLTAPINWIYAPSRDDHTLPYVLLYIDTRLGRTSLPSLDPGTPISIPFRTAKFRGNTSQSITIYEEPGGCLRVLDPVYGNEATLTSSARKALGDAIQLSDLSLIDAHGETEALDPQWFGPEPNHDWCYYFEKAELARQSGDWQEIADLYAQAQGSNLRASLPVENLPFIEGLAFIGDSDAATELTERTFSAQPRLCAALTQLWARVPQSGYHPFCTP